MVHHWHRRGVDTRGVGWVYPSRGGVRSGTARRLVKKPGAAWKTGGGWKPVTLVGRHMETSWGRDGHTGPKYPRDARMCVDFRGLSTTACVTLKLPVDYRDRDRDRDQSAGWGRAGAEYPIRGAVARAVPTLPTERAAERVVLSRPSGTLPSALGPAAAITHSKLQPPSSGLEASAASLTY